MGASPSRDAAALEPADGDEAEVKASASVFEHLSFLQVDSRGAPIVFDRLALNRFHALCLSRALPRLLPSLVIEWLTHLLIMVSQWER